MWRVRCSHGSVSRALFKQLSPLYPPRNAPSSKKYQIPIAESDDTPHAVLPRQRLEAFFFAVVGRVPSRGGGPISAPPPPRLCPGLLPRILFGARPRTWIDRRSPQSPCRPCSRPALSGRAVLSVAILTKIEAAFPSSAGFTRLRRWSRVGISPLTPSRPLPPLSVER